MNWYVAVLKKYGVFNGRARRKEYWMFALFNVIFSSVIYIIELIAGIDDLAIISMIYSLGILIPSLAVAVRRLHDTNRTGWWVLINLIPFLGWLIFLIFVVQDSDAGNNDYGPNPKIITSIDSAQTISY